jgi:predicted membrane-bound mannosyltransferase
MPRIISVSAPRERTLLDYKYNPIYHGSRMASEVKGVFGDHEVMLLLLWAVIAPAAGLAYLVWKKYPRLRLVALFLFAVSLLQFSWQWGGIYSVLRSFLGAK